MSTRHLLSAAVSVVRYGGSTTFFTIGFPLAQRFPAAFIAQKWANGAEADLLEKQRKNKLLTKSQSINKKNIFKFADMMIDQLVACNSEYT